MAGYGSRFKKAGYDTYKPFIEINGKKMVDYVLDVFPSDMKKFIIINPELLTESQLNYLEEKNDVELIKIAPHKNGPGYSIVQAKDILPLDDPFFYAYCDIAWTWDYEKVWEHAQKYEGVVYTRRKFHPHLVNNNFSAFCRLNDKGEVIEIKEKGSFTDNWMEEPLSVGTFYVQSGRELVKALEKRIASDDRVANEFFPSVIFNDLMADKKTVGAFDVDFFIHWGVPSQLEDYEYWKRVIEKDYAPFTSDYSVKNLCCMGGLGSRMKEVADEPKALIPIQNKPMFQYISSRLPIENSTFLTVNPIFNDVNQYVTEPDLTIDLGEQTYSQIDTLKRAKEVLKESKDFLLTSCDAYGYFNLQKFKELKETNPAAIIFTFSPTLLHSQLNSAHSHVSTENDKVTGVHIKSKTSDNDKGLAGFFWFRDGLLFESLDDVQDDDREPIVDHFLKYLVEEKNEDVLFCHLDEYLHLGTPDELKEYFFWHSFKDILLARY